MNITSYLANKCLEFFLEKSIERDGTQSGNLLHSKDNSPNRAQSIFIPPWIPDISTLKQNCDGCGDCITSCESNILFLVEDKYPMVDFSLGSCSFCGKCAESCPQDIFEYDPKATPWDLRAVITLDCLTHNNVLCRTCEEYCEEGAIIIPKANGPISTPLVLAYKCNGCGACFSACPVTAIKITSTCEEGERKIQEKENR